MQLFVPKLYQHAPCSLISYLCLLHEYRDLFVDMDVRNNRSELAIANRHQGR